MTISPGVACDITWDTGMIESPDGNSNSYMHCVSIGFKTLGIWKLESCLPGYTFQISEKRCVPKQSASAATSNKSFAVLNNSCANGEECIGGAICDSSSMRCSCPFDTTADPNTLSCVPSSFKSFHQNSYNAYSSNEHKIMVTTESNILPNVFNVRVPPGSSCSNSEICDGGSFCSLPTKFCLCPDDMEDFKGQCRKPERSIFPAIVSLGDSCSSTVHCRNGTTCIDGQCRCPIPLVQEGDQCVKKLVPFRVGPGEMCNESQVCSRGSTCHPIIPVCICPENTVLQENSCVPVVSAMPKLNIEFSGAGQVAVGFPCHANTDCSNGAYCKTNNNSASCQCLSTHVNINNICEKVIYPGQSGCHHDIQCSASYASSKCFAGQCICPDGFSAIEQTCKSDKQTVQIPPGGSCMIDEDCTGGSKCQDGWCICPEVSMKVISGKCKKVYGDSLPTEMQNNSLAVNTLTSDIKATIPPTKTIEKIAMPFPINSFISSTVSSQQVGDVLPIDGLNQWQTIATTINNSTLPPTSVPVPLPGQPRITGPPLRKSRTHTSTVSISHESHENSHTSTVSIYKTRPGNGVCPTPNNVIRDESTNYLIVCNGEKPLCPPNSYCYITGYANQEYNCCRS
ncbi:unnamed protein product [Acanthocheilonema viteae]|uniref:EGF-like domain-containing protein n=1 Tax=Acanthocheilonema viteae TaxID=6277 RepID=A0A498SAW2_ACAVI|nr:unnamed protein product [Acanthocheilonema viteae]